MDAANQTRMRFIQSRLPSDLYEWLRLRAFLHRMSMNSIVLDATLQFRAAVEEGSLTLASGTLSREQNSAHDSTVKYNVRVEEELYEWLRTRAFHSRTSINTLLTEALRSFRTQHPD